MNWFENAVFYHIYPIGYFGCPRQNDFTSEPTHKILRVIDDIPHIKELGCSAVYFGPVFESSAHGYDTADYTRIDRRLGTNEDFKKVCDALHENGIRVVLDGVFNHVGRDFWAFRDVRENKLGSARKDWFHVREGNDGYNDGFWYEGWEGHYELVKLNLYNPEVKQYLKDCITGWKNEFGIDGLRLDVAYCLDLNFLKELHGHCKWLSEDFFLLGETLHGDYNKWMNPEMLDSVTNYECYKGLYSSFNTKNMHEIAYSLNRQFGSEQWCIYRGKHLLSFADNHDVSRIATILSEKQMLKPLYGLLFGMPGVPSIYYGSEWGMEGDKKNGDPSLRPAVEKPKENELTEWITALAKAKTGSPALNYGSYRNLVVQPAQLIFERETDGERVIVAVNADGTPYHADFDARSGQAVDLITGELHDFGGGSDLPPYSCAFWKTER